MWTVAQCRSHASLRLKVRGQYGHLNAAGECAVETWRLKFCPFLNCFPQSLHINIACSGSWRPRMWRRRLYADARVAMQPSRAVESMNAYHQLSRVGIRVRKVCTRKVSTLLGCWLGALAACKRRFSVKFRLARSVIFGEVGDTVIFGKVEHIGCSRGRRTRARRIYRTWAAGRLARSRRLHPPDARHVVPAGRVCNCECMCL